MGWNRRKKTPWRWNCHRPRLNLPQQVPSSSSVGEDLTGTSYACLHDLLSGAINYVFYSNAHETNQRILVSKRNHTNLDILDCTLHKEPSLTSFAAFSLLF